MMEERSFDEGAVLFRQGEHGEDCFLIVRGTVEVVCTVGANTGFCAMLGPGELVGEMALLDSRPRIATAIAQEPVETIMFDAAYIANKSQYTDPLVMTLLQLVLARYRTSLHARPRTANAPPSISTAGLPELRSASEQIAFEEIRTLAQLRTGITEGQLTTVYQPILDLNSRAVVGIEALVRWTHPLLGVVTPAHFIPVAEKNELILELGDWVFHQACKDVKALNNLAASPLYVSVNISPRQLQDEDHCETLAKIATDVLGEIDKVKIEITERSCLGHHGAPVPGLALLMDRGFKVMVDDFGTGYSNLIYLARHPVETLKIDRAFVSACAEAERPYNLVRAIMNLANTMGIEVVAEGVETTEQAQKLKDAGCRYGQGYFFSPPIAASTVAELL
jgi:EAL domain-containing protein (putative c-di-GMP-specific phosphodiesterase class I)